MKKIKIAGWLNRKTVGFSTLEKKTGLFILCVVGAGLCLYILGGAVCNQPGKRRVIMLHHIHAQPVKP